MTSAESRQFVKSESFLTWLVALGAGVLVVEKMILPVIQQVTQTLEAVLTKALG